MKTETKSPRRLTKKKKLDAWKQKVMSGLNQIAARELNPKGQPQ